MFISRYNAVSCLVPAHISPEQTPLACVKGHAGGGKHTSHLEHPSPFFKPYIFILAANHFQVSLCSSFLISTQRQFRLEDWITNSAMFKLIMHPPTIFHRAVYTLLLQNTVSVIADSKISHAHPTPQPSIPCKGTDRQVLPPCMNFSHRFFTGHLVKQVKYWMAEPQGHHRKYQEKESPEKRELLEGVVTVSSWNPHAEESSQTLRNASWYLIAATSAL